MNKIVKTVTLFTGVISLSVFSIAPTLAARSNSKSIVENSVAQLNFRQTQNDQGNNLLSVATDLDKSSTLNSNSEARHSKDTLIASRFCFIAPWLCPPQ